MVNQRVLGRLFERHGRLVSLKDGPGRPVAYHAIIQPLRYKNKMYLQGAYSDVGYVDPGFYLYLGPGEMALDEGSRDAVLTVGKQILRDRPGRAGVLSGSKLVLLGHPALCD